MLKTPRTIDEHGEVTLDPRLPADVQQSDEAQERWLACANIAMLITGQPLGSSEVDLFARSLYNRRSLPVHRADVAQTPLLEEAGIDPHRRHQLRNREGEWIDMPGRKKKSRKIRPKRLKKFTDTTPRATQEEIRKAGLHKWPEPTEAAKKLMHGHTQSAERWYDFDRPYSPGTDSDEHPPYAAGRRWRHNRIVGGFLAGVPTEEEKKNGVPVRGIAALLGEEHPIVRKLIGGGGLSEEERDTVRRAAHNARSGEAPDALFMAGGPASGKTTALLENPELVPDASVSVDPDAIKELLPEFQQLLAMKDRYAASAVHLESGDIAARLAAEVEALGLNVVIDGTGDSEPMDFIRQLQRKQDAGYDVGVLYATTSTDEAIARAIKRAEKKNGRFVPVPAIREQHAKVSINFEHVRALPWLEHLDVFDDEGHIGEMRNGKFFAIDEKRMRVFQAKASEKWDA